MFKRKICDMFCLASRYARQEVSEVINSLEEKIRQFSESDIGHVMLYHISKY